jgi:DNA-binding LytR/AlgR family response regulator
MIPQQNVIHVIDQLQIIFCQSDDCYTWVHLKDGQRHLIVKSLIKFSKELNPTLFIRVNQSYLINKSYIKIIDKKKKCLVLLNDHIIPFTLTLKELLLQIGNPEN